ncbi:MAG: hypothetical protein F6K54_15080 [Okeania sp. SIO3B5]|uniref:hypothetical protein n=1 Tax=Okeania sp. SIO3B5 TaxID=2607811 RepID=UPI0014015C3A|nr:hypothetical protein [Okeania sp. SIO3B5]NEO54292.1 hypothetical protein [Okeania sp. SIO3B5]
MLDSRLFFRRTIAMFVAVLASFCVFITPSQASVIGNWEGNYKVCNTKACFDAKVYFTITKKGTPKGSDQILGDYWANTGVAGLGKGNKQSSSTTFSMTWNNVTPWCEGTYTGEYDMYEPDKLKWKWVGQDCLGSNEGEGSAVKMENVKVVVKN